MKIFYRISDNSYPKLKLPGTDKRVCFENFREEFSQDDITVIADCCSEETLSWLTGVKVLQFSGDNWLGNAGCLRKSISLSKGLEDKLYFVEDDYLHKKGARDVLLEGFEKGDYVTVFDHPDKYMPEYHYGEVCKISRTESSHWKETISTTMTFATTRKVLNEDLDVWREFTEGFHPHDHFIFYKLKEKGRKLVCSIPGWACHTDLTYSADSNAVSSFALLSCDLEIKIDSWAVDMAITQLEKSVSNSDLELAQESKIVGRFKYLLILDALTKRK